MLKILGKIALITAWALSCWLVFQWARPVETIYTPTDPIATSTPVSKITYTEATPLLPPGWEINPEARFSYDKPPYLRPLDDQWKQEYLEALQIEDDAERYTKLSDLAESLRVEDFPAAILAMKALIEPSGVDEFLASEGYGHLCFRWGSLDFHNAYAYIQQLDAPDLELISINVVLGYAHRDISGALQWVSTLDESVQEVHLDFIFSAPAFIMHHDIDNILASLSKISNPDISIFYYYREVFDAYAEKVGILKAIEKSIDLKLKYIPENLIEQLSTDETTSTLELINRIKKNSTTLNDYKHAYNFETTMIAKQLETNPEILLKNPPRYLDLETRTYHTYYYRQRDAISNLIQEKETDVFNWLDNQSQPELKNSLIISTLMDLLNNADSNINHINLLINKLNNNNYLELVIERKLNTLKLYDLEWLTREIPSLRGSKLYYHIKNYPVDMHKNIVDELEPYLKTIRDDFEQKYLNEMNQFLENERK